jgi:hypothetical protein
LTMDQVTAIATWVIGGIGPVGSAIDGTARVRARRRARVILIPILVIGVIGQAEWVRAASEILSESGRRDM